MTDICIHCGTVITEEHTALDCILVLREKLAREKELTQFLLKVNIRLAEKNITDISEPEKTK